MSFEKGIRYEGDDDYDIERGAGTHFFAVETLPSSSWTFALAATISGAGLGLLRFFRNADV